MFELQGITLPSLPITGLEKVQDLDRHDGPLISHLKRGSDHYLYYWCDCTATSARWMLLRVSETDIFRLVDKVVPLDQVVPDGSLDGFVYFVDSNNTAKSLVQMVRVAHVPREYRPTPGVYLQAAEVAANKQFALLIEKTPAATNIFSLPRIFSQAYSVLYALFVLKPLEYETIPWKDGFGGMRFYEWLFRRIPGEHRPEVEAFYFASPGFVKFTLQRHVAERVCKALADIEDNESKVAAAYWALYNYIKESKLNKVTEHSTAQFDWGPFNETLAELTRRLLSALRIEDDDALLGSATPFEAAKVSLSFVRRLKELKKFERLGVVRFPKVEAVCSI